MVENHPDIRKQEYRGIACLVLSAFCFALMSMFVHLAGDLPSMQKSFFRNLVAALSAVVLLLRAGEPFRIRRENLPYFLMRSIFGTMGVLCNFYAVDHLVLADASILNKMSPFFTVLFSWLILKEKVMPIQLSLIFGAFLGSIFVVKPTFSNLALVPSLLGFFGGICAGAAYTMVRKLGEAGEKGPVIVLFFSVFSCVVVLPWLIFDYHPMTWLMSMFVHLAGDLPSMQKSFFRNLVAALSAVVLLLRAGEPFRIRRENLPYFLMRSIFGTMGVLCNFYAVDHLVLADASILNKMSPFFTVLFSWLILKEKVMPIQLSLIFGAFLGSIFVVKPTFSNLALVPSLLGFFGGICAGAAYTMVRKLGEAGEKGPVIVLFFSVFSCVVVLPWLIFDYHPMTWQQMGILLLAGCAAAGGQFAITAAYRYAPASRISIYDYSQLIFSTMLGFFIFGQVPDGWSFLGYGIICLMAISMFVYNNRKRKNTQKQALLESKELSDVIKM